MHPALWQAAEDGPDLMGWEQVVVTNDKAEVAGGVLGDWAAQRAVPLLALACVSTAAVRVAPCLKVRGPFYGQGDQPSLFAWE